MRKLTFTLVLAVIASLTINKTQAANKFWDPNGTTVNQNDSSLWESAKWATSATPTATLVNFVDGDAALFSAGAATLTNGNYTVTANANHTVAGLFNGNVTDATATNLQINGTGTLT